MRSKRAFAIAFLALAVIPSWAAVSLAAVVEGKPPDEPAVVQRVIKVEGTVDKPRVIFIVSRSRLWKGDFMDKSFLTEILAPVYPSRPADEGETLLTKGGVIPWKR
ncbi:MAG: hypothetical protein HY890_06365 [Deltaproteobacteria bacterium]|nr:hypothetical protein [Deltaproteobacteria bacterium]